MQFSGELLISNTCVLFKSYEACISHTNPKVTEALQSSEQSFQKLKQCQTSLMPFPVMWILLALLLDTSQI